jgi:hypothetical protein
MDDLRKSGRNMAYALGITFYICETRRGLVLFQRPPEDATLIETIEPAPGSNPIAHSTLL